MTWLAATPSAATPNHVNRDLSGALWPVVSRTGVPPSVYSLSTLVADLPSVDGLAARTDAAPMNVAPAVVLVTEQPIPTGQSPDEHGARA